MPKTAVLLHDCGNPLATTDLFRVGMAQTLDDVIDCQRLRYLVFNCELGEVLELGRACVHEDYRNTNVLHMLWKGIARYAMSCGARYLIGCSSLSSQDEAEGMALYETLREKYLVEPSLTTNPVEGRGCRPNGSRAAPPGLPRLFRAYLDISARVCGPPAIDREFKTIDFLTLVDLQKLPDRVLTRFF